MALALLGIIAIILLKYRPIYVVTLSGEKIGYVKDENKLENRIQNEILDMDVENVEDVSLAEMPSYELKLVNRKQETNEEEIILALAEKANITYKYYAVILNNETLSYVENIEEAENAVQQIKEEHEEDSIELDLQVTTNYTENLENIGLETVQVAQEQVEEKVAALIEEDEKSKMPVINGVIIESTPVSGQITSRFGAVSSIRSGAHTGTDIACAKGTKIKAIADGTVVFSQKNGSYGNLIKIDHGNGVESWYAHCNALYAKVGQEIKAGDIIAEVGSTGNSTGPHLHLEIRINGVAINPQKYLYN